ncbi:carbohydrate ABC transporter permease [Kineococcus rhizosphaerae]|uniref:Carbohydrate ABC transporter membrane protein 1 (CUT1 family) n=1 Tax=Kineococcus rhizosphaerae TaxID=559628 RepID=A0A2T0R6J5_9ACTN|nr:sugar ABC transporter permease [Kineococcus rhizosphaerae]PRY16778.1 carbohydrate ABC transporter membrane protein 1 (CUT1 family) [Kineococcus rhizosphaerae]
MAVTVGQRTTRRAPELSVKRQGVRRFWPQYAAVSPFYLIFLVFGAFPILFSIYLSFTDWDGIGQIKFVGLQQYAYLFQDSRFWNAVGNTLVIWVISTVPMLFLALVMAFLLHQNIRMKGFYRVAFFIPNVTSMVAMAIVFGSVFSDSFGIVNSALTALHLPTVAWLSTEWGIKITIAVMVIWRWTGYNAILYLAALQAVPDELYDAAKVDGAGFWRTFFSVTIPMLRPVILFTVITSTIGGLGLFTEPQILFGAANGNGTVGGVNEAGMTIVLYQYDQAFSQLDFGYGSAIAWALFALAAVFAIINWRLLRDRDAVPKVTRRAKEVAK